MWGHTSATRVPTARSSRSRADADRRRGEVAIHGRRAAPSQRGPALEVATSNSPSSLRILAAVFHARDARTPERERAGGDLEESPSRARATAKKRNRSAREAIGDPAAWWTDRGCSRARARAFAPRVIIRGPGDRVARRRRSCEADFGPMAPGSFGHGGMRLDSRHPSDREEPVANASEQKGRRRKRRPEPSAGSSVEHRSGRSGTSYFRAAMLATSTAWSMLGARRTRRSPHRREQAPKGQEFLQRLFAAIPDAAGSARHLRQTEGRRALGTRHVCGGRPGIAPNGARVELEGMNMLTIAEASSVATTPITTPHSLPDGMMPAQTARRARDDEGVQIRTRFARRALGARAGRRRYLRVRGAFRRRR